MRVGLDAGYGVGDFLLAREAGLCQIGLVTGVSVAPYYWKPSDTSFLPPASGEVKVLTSLPWRQSLQEAVRRMTRQAQRRGASLVIGVKVSDEAYEMGETGLAVRLVATGIAVRRDTVSPADGSSADDDLVLTNLSVPDYWLLIRQGAHVLGMVCSFGRVAVAVDLGRGTTDNDPGGDQHGGWEAGMYGKAVTLAYADARAGLREQLTGFGADGAVGVQIEHVRHKAAGAGRVIIVRSVGTAIRRAVPGTGDARPALTIMPVRGLDRLSTDRTGRHA
jgi:uncharacterized protein YbjQ (UPF0145 family)